MSRELVAASAEKPHPFKSKKGAAPSSLPLVKVFRGLEMKKRRFVVGAWTKFSLVSSYHTDFNGFGSRGFIPANFVFDASF